MDRLKRVLDVGEWLFRRGDSGDCAYVIESGAIDIVADDSVDARRIARLGPKDFFGEMALAGEGVRSAGAVAAEPTTLLVISRDHFQDRLRVADPLLRHLLRTTVRRLRNINDQVYGTSSTPPPLLADPKAKDAVDDQESAYEHIETERRLSLALERGEFDLHYQPIVRCSDGVVDGFEALLRWQQADGTFISPAVFVPLAELSGLIVPIGRWIINHAAAALKRFDAAAGRPLYVSVNLSAQQFGDPLLLPAVRDAIQSHALAPKQLTLEVTESLVIENIDRVIGLLNDFRDSGAKISVDDFGTGYSSLSYLHRLPADVLKLDRVFVKQAEQGDAAIKIVRAVTMLAHDLGMRVVQEGMETELQAVRTRDVGVDWAQGYFYSRPLHIDKALDFVARNRPSELPTAS